MSYVFRDFKKEEKKPPVEASTESQPAEFPSPKEVVRRNSGKLPGWIFLPTAVLVIAILYWAQEVLVPIAIAVLLTFVLNPVVSALESLSLRRVSAVTITVAFAFSILLAISWV